MDNTGKVILSKGIKLDRQYNNIVDYTEQQMVTLCTTNKVYEASNCSFLRNDKAIDLDIPYGTAIQANYIAFENPDYSGKWFFGFIDSVEYLSDSVSRIHFTIDECSTWRDYWQIKTCFTVREHVNDDTVGLHTVPENLELGEYQINSTSHIGLNGELPIDPELGETQFYVCFCVTKPPEPNNPVPIIPSIGRDIGSVFTPLIFFAVNTANGFDDANDILEWYRSKFDNVDTAIVNMYMIPYSAVDTSVYQTWTYQNGNTSKSIKVYGIRSSRNMLLALPITQATVMSGLYTPRNKKLYTYPFCYLYLNNKGGEDVVYHWEDGFDYNTGTQQNPVYTKAYRFSIALVPSTSLSAKLFPVNYKGLNETSPYYGAWNYGINFAKIPVCAWTNDVYTNWLTQNGVNVATNLITGAGGALLGLATGGLGLVAGGLALGKTIADSIGEVHKAHTTPPQAAGDTNTGDVGFAYTFNNITAYQMTIRREYAEIIDGFFDRQGYKVNKLKVPNETGRTYWNYVQIAESESIGYTKTGTNVISVPSESMDTINGAYRKGVTIWHDHANIGDYSLSNTIVTP